MGRPPLRLGRPKGRPQAPFQPSHENRYPFTNWSTFAPPKWSKFTPPLTLTCTPCNNRASRAEQAAVEARREPKARIDMPGLPTQTGYVSVDASGRIDVRMSRPRVPREAVSALLRSRQPFTMIFMEPTSRYANIPWLKAAYLSVFSLLGTYGYRFAQGPAVERVRSQIMNPDDEIIRHFAVKTPAAWQERDGIVMNRRQTPCWAVKMRDCIVLLPRSWDVSFYDWTDSLSSPDDRLTIGGGPLWYPAKFGQRQVASIPFPESNGPGRMLGEDLFGKQGRVTKGDNVVPFVVEDWPFTDFPGPESPRCIPRSESASGRRLSPSVDALRPSTGCVSPRTAHAPAVHQYRPALGDGRIDRYTEAPRLVEGPSDIRQPAGCPR